MRHEAIKQKNILKVQFSPEIYISSSDVEFLDEFLKELRQCNLDPDDLVFSGFDGKQAAAGENIPVYPYIFAMNETGWRNALKYRDYNPAQYAEEWEIPCIGLYDKSQLAEGRSYGLTQDAFDLDGRVELANVHKGADLDSLGPDAPVEEVVVHRNFPNLSPTDALVGLVFVERVESSTHHRHGL